LIPLSPEIISHSQKLKSTDAMMGPPTNKMNPNTQGEINKYPVMFVFKALLDNFIIIHSPQRAQRRFKKHKGL